LERFRTITKSYFRGADAVLVFYDITSRQSFEHVEQWVNDAQNLAVEHCAAGGGYIPTELNLAVEHFMLVGNKCDMAEEREVAAAEGEELAEKLGATFMEVSAKDNTGLSEAFACIAAQALDPRLEEKTAKERTAPKQKSVAPVVGGLARGRKRSRDRFISSIF
jgi:Ras-related protein Rab-1A